MEFGIYYSHGTEDWSENPPDAPTWTFVHQDSDTTRLGVGVDVWLGLYARGFLAVNGFDLEACPPAPVGGVVIPANTLALVSPWLAVIGLVGCIGTAVVVAKKQHKRSGVNSRNQDYSVTRERAAPDQGIPPYRPHAHAPAGQPMRQPSSSGMQKRLDARGYPNRATNPHR